MNLDICLQSAWKTNQHRRRTNGINEIKYGVKREIMNWCAKHPAVLVYENGFLRRNLANKFDGHFRKIYCVCRKHVVVSCFQMFKTGVQFRVVMKCRCIRKRIVLNKCLEFERNAHYLLSIFNIVHFCLVLLVLEQSNGCLFLKLAIIKYQTYM